MEDILFAVTLDDITHVHCHSPHDEKLLIKDQFSLLKYLIKGIPYSLKPIIEMDSDIGYLMRPGEAMMITVCFIQNFLQLNKFWLKHFWSRLHRYYYLNTAAIWENYNNFCSFVNDNFVFYKRYSQRDVLFVLSVILINAAMLLLFFLSEFYLQQALNVSFLGVLTLFVFDFFWSFFVFEIKYFDGFLRWFLNM